MKVKKKTLTILIVLLTALAVAALSVGLGYAIWENTRRATYVAELPSEDWNLSAIDQVFAALDADGNPLAEVTDADDVKAVAFVGYIGLTAELQIPSATYITVAGKRYSRAVTKVLVLGDSPQAALFRNYLPYTYTQSVGLRDDRIVTSLIVPESVVYIASGAFASMQQLQTLRFLGSAAITVQPYAFSNCLKLQRSQYFCARSIVGDLSLIFSGTDVGI